MPKYLWHCKKAKFKKIKAILFLCYFITQNFSSHESYDKIKENLRGFTQSFTMSELISLNLKNILLSEIPLGGFYSNLCYLN